MTCGELWVAGGEGVGGVGWGLWGVGSRIASGNWREVA